MDVLFSVFVNIIHRSLHSASVLMPLKTAVLKPLQNKNDLGPDLLKILSLHLCVRVHADVCHWFHVYVHACVRMRTCMRMCVCVCLDVMRKMLNEVL